MGGGDHEYAFVSGMKKSGTNWVADLIGTHPDVLVWGEFHLELLQDALRSYAAPEWIPSTVAEIDAVSPSVARFVLDEHRARAFAESGRDHPPRLGVDHTPGWLALHLGASARYVHVIRDVRDVIVSDAFHSMRLGEYPAEVHAAQRPHIDAWQRDPWYFADHPEELLHPSEVTRLALTWVDIVRKAIDLADRQPDLVEVVRYEDLHQDVLAGRRALLEFLGLDPSLVTHDLDQELQPAFGGRAEDPHAFNRKGIVGDHRNYLFGSARQEIERHAGGLLRQLGYE